MKNMYFRSFLITGIWMLMLPLTIAAQERDLQVNFDFAAFRYDQEQVLWEFYYSIPRKNMNYIRGERGDLLSLVDLRLKVEKDGNMISEQGWRTQNTLADTSEMSQGSIIDRIKILLEPGEYQMRLLATDSNDPALKDSVSFNVNIEPFPTDRVAISDVELAVRIQRGAKDPDHPFYKNTLNVIPNPSRIYGDEYPFIYFYTETYNLNYIPGQQDYYFTYFITDGNGNQVEEIEKVSRKRSAKYESRVEWGAVKVGNLISGTYVFHASVEDQENQELTEKQVRFFVYNPDRISPQPVAQMNEESLFMSSEFANMPESELISEFEKITYIATTEQTQLFNNINKLEDKRRWLFKFWYSKDPVPATPFNEYRAEYMERVRYCNENFSTFNKEGWKTDRGRVYIMYGPPDFVERFPNMRDRKPGEVWTYDRIQGGVLFIYVDINVNGEYRLVHSNARGEISDYTYYELYRDQ